MKRLACLAVALCGLLTIGSSAVAQLPCDIYSSAGTPCVAAHSTTRALFAAYDGSLYEVQRASDNATLNIGLLEAGGYADAAAQDSFCSRTSCTIIRIYDQTSNHNDLTVQGAGGNGPADSPASATALPVEAGGHKVYGILISVTHTGYRIDTTKGVAKNGQPEGAYMVTSGTTVNQYCCFDYGNAETNNDDNGAGHMDAINFSTSCWFSSNGPCYGNGPWVQADMENGLFQSNKGYSLNSSNTGWPDPFVTAVLKNNGQNKMALRAGNAQSGGLTTEYDGGEPNGYSPMRQEGAIVLGTGGDNSGWGTGSFFEGVMTSGYPADATENEVQANIVSVGYSTSITCTTTEIVPYISVAGVWSAAGKSSVTVASGTAVDLGPQPLSGGSWAWTGPKGFTSISREIDNIALSAGANVYTATYTNSCGAKSTRTFAITVSGSTSGFSLTPSASTLSVKQGASGTDKITVADTGGFTGSVAFTVSGLPNGVTASFSPASSASSSVLTLTASSSATTGAFTVTVTGTSGSTTASTTFTLDVTTSVTGSACTVDYTINPQSSSNFGANITIKNGGTTALSNWVLSWTFANGQTIASSWNGAVSQSGANVTVSEQAGQSWQNIPASGSYSGFGFNGTWNGTTNTIPAAFSLNGTACTVN